MTRKLRQRPRLLRVVTTGSGLALTAYAVGYYVSFSLPEILFSGALKYAIGLVGVVWLFSLNVYNKLYDVTDMAGLDYRQHRNLELEISTRLSFFWMRALFLACIAFVMYLPSLLHEANIPISKWLFGMACSALALALFSLRRLLDELEEIRELRSHVKELDRKEAERVALSTLLRDSIEGEWEEDSQLKGFRKPSLPDKK